MELKLSRDCWQCRNRHVRCDQSQVPCGKCLKSGLDCSQERPIRWVKGVAIRGKMQGLAYETPSERQAVFGRKNTKRIVFKDPTTGPSTRPLAKAAKTAKTNRGMPKYPGENAPGIEHDGAVASHWLPPPTPALQDSSVLSLDRASRYYLDYYEQICEDFVLSQMDKHQLRSLAPLALHDQVLRTSLLALASRHFANLWQPFYPDGTSNNTKANHDALIFKHHAIEALSEALRSQKEVGKETTMASAFIFILLDLLESGGFGWGHHLKGAKSLFCLVQPKAEATHAVDQKPLRLKQNLRSFLFRKLYFAECLGSALSPTDYTTSPSPQISLDEHDIAQESMEDSFLGCPELLLRAIRFISTERDIIAANPRNMQGEGRCVHEVRLVAMLVLVETFDFYKSPFRHAQDIAPSARRDQKEMERLRALSEVYKCATLIYGRRVLSALRDVDISFDNDVSRLLELLDMFKDDRESLKCVLWPLFVAGLECTSPVQRQHFVTHLEEFWMTTKCLNAINAAKILEDHWNRSEAETTCWPFESGRFGRLWLLI